MVKVISFTGPFTDTGEYRNTAVLQSDIVDHFHHNNGLADTSAAEEAHFPAAGKRDKQIDNLNAGFKNPHGRILFRKFGGFTMNGHHFFLTHRPQSIHRPADHVEDAAKPGFTHRHHDLFTGIFYPLPSHQTVGHIHGNGPDHIVTQMLGDFNNQIVLFIADCRVGDMKCRIDRRQIALREFYVYNRPHNLRYCPSVFSHL